MWIAGAILELGRVGGKFFLIGIMALVMFQTDNIVIGHYLGAAKVPPYSLAYRLFSYTSLPQSILFSYLWAAYTEAIARKDIVWVKRTFVLNLGLGMAFSLAAVEWCFLCAAVHRLVGRRPWCRPPGWSTGWRHGAMINAFTNPMACLLAAASHFTTS